MSRDSVLGPEEREELVRLRSIGDAQTEREELARLQALRRETQVVLSWYQTQFVNGVARSVPPAGLTLDILHEQPKPGSRTRHHLRVLDAEGVRELGRFDLYPGLNLLFGDSGSGKTYLLSRMQEAASRLPNLTQGAVAWGEPDDERRGFLDGGLTLASLSAALADVWKPNLRILWLDSLKYLTTAGGSQFITRRGMPKDQLAFLTSVSRTFLKWDQVLVATLNPLEEDPDVLQSWADNFKGVVSQVVFIQGPGRYQVSSRFAASRAWRPVGTMETEEAGNPLVLPLTSTYRRD